MKEFLLLAILFLLISCGKEPAKKSSEAYQNVSSIYSSQALTVKVYFEPGAEPYTDKVLNVSIWNLFRTNMETLLQGRNMVLTVPMDLGEMTPMPEQNKASWSLNDVLTLAEKYPLTEVSGSTEFQIFFVNGHSEEGSGVIGFHINNTKIMAIFKDVIKSTANSSQSFVPKYVEQSTIIHEMGHALGLVNNGIPMTSGHQDKEYGAHCSNPECVMYYSNEGTSSMVNFVKNAYTKGSTTMFDSQCLKDAQNYKN